MKSLPVSAFLAVAVFVGCDRIGLVDRTPSATGLGGSTGQGGRGGASGGSSGSANVQGLPCEVQALMLKYCASCHGSPTAGGAPRSLMTYADLTRTDMMDPRITEAEQAVQLMQSESLPMPPPPAAAPTASEIATLQTWIDNGYPTGSCTGDAGSPLADDPLNADPTCTSNTTWKNGTRGSASMEPGLACIGCHATTGGEAPTFTIAGTLYPTGHEPDNCNGASGQSTGAKIVVTGNNGSSLTLTPNSVGNFFTTTSLPPPYKAKVVSASGSERVMSGTASSGDCNSCHTQNGAQNAPGRITLP